LSYSGGDVVVNGGSSALLWNGSLGQYQFSFVSRSITKQTRTVYYSFLAQLVSGAWGSAAHALVGYIDDKGGDNKETGAIFGRLNLDSTASAVIFDEWTEAGSGAPVQGQTYLIVGKLTWDGDANAFVQSDIWINPTSATTESGTHAMKDGEQAIAGGMDGLEC